MPSSGSSERCRPTRPRRPRCRRSRADRRYSLPVNLRIWPSDFGLLDLVEGRVDLVELGLRTGRCPSPNIVSPTESRHLGEHRDLALELRVEEVVGAAEVAARSASGSQAMPAMPACHGMKCLAPGSHVEVEVGVLEVLVVRDLSSGSSSVQPSPMRRAAIQELGAVMSAAIRLPLPSIGEYDLVEVLVVVVEVLEVVHLDAGRLLEVGDRRARAVDVAVVVLVDVGDPVAEGELLVAVAAVGAAAAAVVVTAGGEQRRRQSSPPRPTPPRTRKRRRDIWRAKRIAAPARDHEDGRTWNLRVVGQDGGSATSTSDASASTTSTGPSAPATAVGAAAAGPMRRATSSPSTVSPGIGRPSRRAGTWAMAPVAVGQAQLVADDRALEHEVGDRRLARSSARGRAASASTCIRSGRTMKVPRPRRRRVRTVVSRLTDASAPPSVDGAPVAVALDDRDRPEVGLADEPGDEDAGRVVVDLPRACRSARRRPTFITAIRSLIVSASS